MTLRTSGDLRLRWDERGAPHGQGDSSRSRSWPSSTCVANSSSTAWCLLLAFVLLLRACLLRACCVLAACVLRACCVRAACVRAACVLRTYPVLAVCVLYACSARLLYAHAACVLRACCVRAVCLPVLAACRTEVPELLGAGIRLARSQCQSRLVVAGSSPPPTRTSFILIAIPVIPVASHVPTSIICRLRFPTSIIGGPVGCPAPQVKAGKCSAYATGWISATLPSGSHNGGEQADQRGAGTALAGAGWVLDLCSGHRYYRTITVRIVYRLCVVMG